MKIFDRFKKPKTTKDLSDFPTKEQRIEKMKGQTSRMRKRIRQLREDESNPEKLRELQAALDNKMYQLKKMEN